MLLSREYTYSFPAQFKYNVNIMRVFKVTDKTHNMFVVQFTMDLNFLSHLKKGNTFDYRKERTLFILIN